MSYGVPYQGSKNKIADWVIDHIPDCEVFVDAFAGGCAITDAILRHRASTRVIANDLDKSPVELFKRALHGDYACGIRWISHQEFEFGKDADPAVRFVYSFGNDGVSYAYSYDREPLMCAAHYAIMYRQYGRLRDLMPDHADAIKEAVEAAGEGITARRIAFCHAVARLTSLSIDNARPVHSERVERLGAVGVKCAQHLISSERLSSLAQPELLERLTTFAIDYRELAIPDGAVVYCDPPYANTKKYSRHAFDHDAFLDWAAEVGKTHPTIISEYAIEDPRFVVIAERERCCVLNASQNRAITRTERLYTIKGGAYHA